MPLSKGGIWHLTPARQVKKISFSQLWQVSTLAADTSPLVQLLPGPHGSA